MKSVQSIGPLPLDHELRLRDLESRRIAADERERDRELRLRDLETRRIAADEREHDQELRLRSLESALAGRVALLESERHDATDGLEAVREEIRAANARMRTQKEIIDRQARLLREAMGAGRTYPPLKGERGVLDASLPYGDVRRYGIAPDGRTNWEKSGHVDTVVRNSSELGLEIFWPAGFYRTSLNISRSNVSFRFEPGAEFAGVVHVTSERLDDNVGHPPARNVTFSGPLVTYDRFGTINVRGLVADEIVVKTDPAKNLDGARNRGVHIYFGSRDFEIGSITVEKGEGSNNKSMHAAISIDGHGDNPRNIRIGKVWVKDSRVRGVFVTGPGHQFGSIRVDGYCDGPPAPMTQDGGVESAGDCQGVWFRRASGTVARVEIAQPPGERRDAAYAVVFDGPEVRWAPPWIEPIYTERGMTAHAITVRNPPRHAVGVGVYGSPAHARIERITVEDGPADHAPIVSRDATSILPKDAKHSPASATPTPPRRG